MGSLNKFLQSLFGQKQEPATPDTPPAPSSSSGTAADSNLSTLDFMSIPAASRRVLRILLRQSEISDAGLRELVAEMPDAKRPTDAEYADAIADLTDRTWVVQYEIDGMTYYRINLGSKVGSDESRSKPADISKRDGPSMPELWDAVDNSSDTDYRKKHATGSDE